MRKIIAGGIAVAVLSSCGAPSYDTPEQALLDNQKQVVEKLEKVSDLTPAQANSTGMMDMQIESSDLNLSMDMAYNFDVNQDTNDTQGNMNISFDGNVAADMGLPVSEFAGKLDFDLITLTNKVFFKLNILDITKPSNDPSILMLTSYATPYLEKWYFMEDALATTSNANLVTFQKDLLEILKTQRLFNHISTNENENFYDYNVELNSDTIVNITKQINDISSTQEENQLTEDDFTYITEDDFTYISEDITQLNQEVEMNIRISKENPEYFIFTINDENATFTIENNDTNIDLQLVDSTVDMKFDFVGTKKINGISAQITANQGSEEVFAGIMNLTTNGTDTNMQLEANVNSQGETMKITMNLDDTTTAQTLEITQPEDARDFQEIIMEVMGQMMGGVPVSNQSDFTEVNPDQIEVNITQEINPVIAE